MSSRDDERGRGAAPDDSPRRELDRTARDGGSPTIEEVLAECRQRGILLDDSSLDRLSDGLRERLRRLLKSEV